MDLTPHDIQEKQFHDTFRGYSHEEVDLFLDEAAEAFATIYRDHRTLLNRIEVLERELEEARGTEDMLKRTLLTAQRTAEEAVAEARAKAQAVVSAAEQKAHEMVAAAERRAQEVVAIAQARERELQVSMDALRRFEEEYRARLRAFIEAQLKALSEGSIVPGAGPPRTAQAARQVSEPGGSPPAPAASATGARPPARGPSAPEPASAQSGSPGREAASSTGLPDGAPAHERAGPAGRPSPRPEEGQGPLASEQVGAQGGPGLRLKRVLLGRARPESEGEGRTDEEGRSIKDLFWGDE